MSFRTIDYPETAMQILFSYIIHKIHKNLTFQGGVALYTTPKPYLIGCAVCTDMKNWWYYITFILNSKDVFRCMFFKIILWLICQSHKLQITIIAQKIIFNNKLSF